ncbi:collagenous domain-containing protein [Megavirus baoshan]|uniref:Collagenous domain-containing protein n=1 Tax=Megavirus baoshan TaxID=2496520 RepID=A0A3Q8U883_9VIRU|nr:collagenous domain-containing protein [Megavirus baoshan]AZL89511.1 collagenous domain-containing protein [Megavirus baoshan]
MYNIQDNNICHDNIIYNSPYAYYPYDNTVFLQDDVVNNIPHISNINNDTIINTTIDNSCFRQSHITIGTGPPNNTCGNNQDVYIDSLTNIYYVKINCVWVIRGNLTDSSRNPHRNCNEKGAKGDKGDIGPKGELGDKGLKGETITPNSSFINSFLQYSSGAFSSIAPPNSTIAYITAVGGGGGGLSGTNTIGLHGGGGGGAIVKYTVSVSNGQIIHGEIGSGGKGGTISTLPTKGSDTVINIGTLVLVAGGGLMASETSGGNGGNVYSPMGTVSGGAGGTDKSVLGKNGNINFSFFAGGGGGFSGGNGGNILAFTGGLGIGLAGGGGGASAFANGGNGVNSSYPATNGCLGSGGGGASQTSTNSVSPLAGNGGNGFIRIDYHTY